MDARDFVGTDVISLIDWPREKIEYVFKVAEKMEPVVRNRTKIPLLGDKTLAVAFYLPSTRTRTSFQSAMVRLGGSVIGWESGTSTRARGKDVASLAEETDKDTAIMLDHYADAVVVRHDHEGAAKEFAKWATIPVINGGDGYGPTSEHPTQALLDLYTMKKEQGKIDGLNILHLGTNARNRGAHSLNYALARFKDVNVYVSAPPEGHLAPEEEKPLNDLGLRWKYVDDLQDVIRDIDVLIAGKSEGREKYVVRAEKLKNAKDNLIVMHYLPRGNEIDLDVDGTRYAKYLWEEAWNGVPVRMALLSLVFGREI